MNEKTKMMIDDGDAFNSSQFLRLLFYVAIVHPHRRAIIVPRMISAVWKYLRVFSLHLTNWTAYPLQSVNDFFWDWFVSIDHDTNARARVGPRRIEY